MNNPVTIKIADLIGSSLCISAEDGQKVFEKIKPLIQEGRTVVVSFERVTMLISLFLNAAIGQLYGTFSEEEIRARVNVNGLADDDLEMLKRVVDNAKRYYANPKDYDAAWSQDKDNSDEPDEK
ncbi:MAG: hypothetical protein GQF41_1087 [Candidatus Rifleibacterium amylolyticum]|nr:MAG: hypothetical protein GQF41_1087 [Candidatus Rifleibacterium amylolyticum]